MRNETGSALSSRIYSGICLAAGFMMIALPAYAEPASLNHENCEYLMRHVPSPDTNYQPGVDAFGNPVAPADLNDNSVRLPDEVTITVTPDLAQLLHLPITTRYRPEASLGTIKYDREGNLTYNGQPLAGSAQNDLIAYCREKTANPEPPPQNLLQSRPDLLKQNH